MSDTFVDTVVPAGQAARAPRGPSSNATVEDVMSEGGRSIPINRDGTTSEALDVTADGGRVLPDSVREKLKAIGESARAARAAERAARGGDSEGDDGEEDPDAPPGEVVAEVPATGKPAVVAAVAAPDPTADLRAQIARYEASNRELVAKHEALETEHRKARETPAAPKLLVEAHAGYVDDQTGALKRFIAASLGVDDPNDAAVTAELRDLFTDLTALHLGVTPDASHTAKREAARARQLFAREKRERKAAEESVAQRGSADADTKKDTDAAQFISTKLKADDFPHLHALSKDLDGLDPGALLWKVMQREIKTGKLDPAKGDDHLISEAAKLVETHYQSLANRFQTITKSKPSTEKPIEAASSARTEQRQSHGARTLTAADASVAPTTPPAKKPKTTEKPTFKSKEERQKWALRHIATK